ncbi:MAG: acyltransferase [Mycobacterium sp.]|nr:acyltransferase [Mycobacterium sp.]
MRALAVMLVVVAHAGMGDIVPGGSGVTIFFGISGFIITYLLLKENTRTGTFDIKAFYTRRVLKILPPLIAVVVIPTLALGLVEPIEWNPLLGIIFFYYNWLRVNGVFPQLTGSEVVWSLSIEEQFYVAFAIIWFAALKFRLGAKWIAAGVFATALFSLGTRILLVASASTGAIDEDRIYYGSDTRMEAIALGVLTAFAFYHSPGQPSRWSATRTFVRACQTDLAFILAILMFTASLVLRNEWFRYTFRFSIQSFVACVIIIYGFGTQSTAIRRAFDSAVRMRIVQFIGLSSYSIYLTHLIVMSYAIPTIGHLAPLVRVPLLTVLGTLSGFVIYLAVERPVQSWRNRTKALP